MCLAPKVPKEKDPAKPEYLHNTYLDSTYADPVNNIRKGRSSLRIDLGSASGLTLLNQPALPASPPPRPTLGLSPRLQSIGGLR